MLCVWLPLNGDLHNQGLNGALTATNTGATINNNGKIGKCYSFAKNAYLDINKEVMTSFSTEASISLWIKINSWNTNWDTIFQAGGGSTAWTQYTFGLLRNSANYLCFCTSNGSTATQGNCKTGDLTLGQWYHITCVYKTGHNIIYVNGIQVQDYANSIVPNFSGITSIKIGGLASNYKCDCLINDVRIYSHALSAKEVEEIAKGLVLHYPLNNNGLGNENLITNSMFSNLSTSGNVIKDTTKLFNGMFTCKISKTGATSNTYLGWTSQNLVSQLTPGEKITVSVWAYRESNHGIDAGCEWRMYQEYKDNGTKKTDWTGFYNSSSWTIGQWIRFSHTYTIRENITGVYLNLNVIKNGTYWIAQPKVERGSLVTNWCPSSSELNLPTNIIYDTSGYGNNGTIVGSLESITPSPRYDCATHLECSSPSTNDNIGLTYIQAPLGLTAPMQMSVCWWGHPESGYGNSSGHAAWCTSALSGDPSDYNSTAFHHRDSKFDICLNSASTTSLSLTFNNYTLHEWHYYCVTYDGKIAILYKDGVETNRSTISNTEAPLKTFTKMFIGFSKAGGVWRKTLGSYSDFRVYITALTPNQIKELYNTSMTIDNQGNIYARELVE